ncbi:MAG: hypothetical protein AAFN70_13615, partial [Planctomycetota bacterium]
TVVFSLGMATLAIWLARAIFGGSLPQIPILNYAGESVDRGGLNTAVFTGDDPFVRGPNSGQGIGPAGRDSIAAWSFNQTAGVSSR